MSRIQRIARRIVGRSRDYGALRATASIEQALGWAERTPADMFNKNVLRAKVVQGLVEAMACNRFYEMGTYHAATTIGAQRFLQLPVWSCEVNRRNYLVSRAVTLGLPQITLTHDDSRNFLHTVCPQLKQTPEARPFFYLDAHENELDLAALPLEEELRDLLALDEFVAMIDDFLVPGRADFAAGNYGGVVVNVALIQEVLLASGLQTCYFPAYPAAQDTGYPSGYCLFWRSARLDAAFKTPQFPLNLIRPYALDQQVYLAVP